MVAPSGVHNPEDVEKVLTPELAAAMLDVVLKWASVDAAISQLYVSLHGLNDIESADAVSDKPPSWKLHRIKVRLRPHTPELAKAIGRLKKQYEQYSEVRNTIAHCHFAGYLKSDPQRGVFLRYRRYDDGLCVDAIHISMFEEATKFGIHLRAVIDKLDNNLRDEMPTTTR